MAKEILYETQHVEVWVDTEEEEPSLASSIRVSLKSNGARIALVSAVELSGDDALARATAVADGYQYSLDNPEPEPDYEGGIEKLEELVEDQGNGNNGQGQGQGNNP